MLRAKRFQLVELRVPANITATNQQVNFDNQPQLQSISGGRQIFVEAIEAYNVNDVPLSPFTPGQPVASDADFVNGVLTLSVDASYNFQYIPLVTLHRTFSNQAGTQQPSVFDLFGVNSIWQVDWTKSYVTMVGAPSVLTAFSYLFGVYYRYSDDREETSQAGIAANLVQLQQQVNAAFAQLAAVKKRLNMS